MHAHQSEHISIQLGFRLYKVAAVGQQHCAVTRHQCNPCRVGEPTQKGTKIVSLRGEFEHMGVLEWYYVGV